MTGPPTGECSVTHEVGHGYDDQSIAVSASSHVLEGPLGLWYVIDMLELGPSYSVTLTVRYWSVDFERAAEVAREKPTIYRRLRLRERIGFRIAGRKT